MFALVALTFLAATPVSPPAPAAQPASAQSALVTELNALQPNGAGQEARLHLVNGEAWHGRVLARSAHFLLFQKDDGRHVTLLRSSVEREETAAPGERLPAVASTQALNLVSAGTSYDLTQSALTLEWERRILGALSVYALAETGAPYAGLGAGVGARYYAKGKALDGWYADLHARAYEGDGSLGHLSRAGGGFELGYTHVFDNHWGLGFGVGVDAAHVTQPEEQTLVGVGGCGGYICIPSNETIVTVQSGMQPIPSTRFAVGYAF